MRVRARLPGVRVRVRKILSYKPHAHTSANNEYAQVYYSKRNDHALSLTAVAMAWRGAFVQAAMLLSCSLGITVIIGKMVYNYSSYTIHGCME